MVKRKRNDLSVPQDRESSFDPKIVPKRQKEISQIDEKIIAMYACGLTTNQISEQIEDIYGFEISQSFVSNVTNKILPDIVEWQNRPLSTLYPIVLLMRFTSLLEMNDPKVSCLCCLENKPRRL